MAGEGDADASRRVKVYVLNQEGSWDDRGTGLVNVEMIKECNQAGFRVRSEEDPAVVVLQTKIFHEDVFHRQVDTIITWVDPEKKEEVALSFQEISGAQSLWERICKVQGKSDNSFDAYEENRDSNAGKESARRDFKMPVADMANLEEIQTIVLGATLSTKDSIIESVLEDGWLKKLSETFEMVEDLEAENSLHMCFRIYKGLLLLNEPSLIESLLSSELVDGTMGALEYDPELGRRQRHRDYLQRPEIFKQPVPIADEGCLNRIHMNFRLNYLKDVVMARYIDDLSFATIRELTSLNNAAIVKRIRSDMPFLSKLQQCLMNKNGRTKFIEGFLFLQELFDIVKQLPEQTRTYFYRAVTEAGFFETFAGALADSDRKIRNASTDCLSACLTHNPSPIRRFMVEHKGDGDKMLLPLLVKVLVEDEDTGLKSQVAEIIRLLIDPSNMEEVAEKSTFLDLFYAQMESLLSPFQCLEAEYAEKPTLATRARRRAADAARMHLTDLFAVCVQSHGYRMKHYILRNNLVQLVLLLLRHKEKYLVLTAIRFFRTCIGANDVFYNQYLIKNDLFGGVFNVFKTCYSRSNLISSAITELLDFIRVKNMKSVIKHVVERFRDSFGKLGDPAVTKALVLKYEQATEFEESQSNNGTATPAESSSAPASSSWGTPSLDSISAENRRRMAKFREQEQEESYFDRDDDEDEAQPSLETSGRSDDAAALADKDPIASSDALGSLVATYDDDSDNDDARVSPSKTGAPPSGPPPTDPDNSSGSNTPATDKPGGDAITLTGKRSTAEDGAESAPTVASGNGSPVKTTAEEAPTGDSSPMEVPTDATASKRPKVEGAAS